MTIQHNGYLLHFFLVLAWQTQNLLWPVLFVSAYAASYNEILFLTPRPMYLLLCYSTEGSSSAL